jgi:pimeloyl-ACP methyl ester carboxylesterase
MRLAAPMQLHVDEWGTAERVALLLHGFMGSAEGWWRVGPALADRGYRVLALDLPGHGRSPADPELTIPRAAQHVVETVAARTDRLDVAIGHSFGGLLLSVGLDALAPSAAVYVDAPFTVTGPEDPVASRSHYEQAVAARTVQHLREDRPSWSERDREVEERAAQRFDIATAVALDGSAGGTWLPRVPPRSLVIRADPSRYVSDGDIEGFRSAGLHVASIPGSAHTVWYSHFTEFMTALDEFLADEAGRPTTAD